MKSKAMLALGIPALALLIGCASTAQSAPTDERRTDTLVMSAGQETQERPKLDVPYVPTPTAVVEEMLRMAKVGKDDMVYDLGCGDGRIVVTAAEKYGARGMGVDIDPQRIRESRENAEKAGVTDKVQFEIKDLFKMDFKDATVVTLYLLPDINVRLRPRLLDELRPGTRIVSHDFDMGDWKPDQKSEVNSGRTHTIYYWVIPAKVNGTWTWGTGADAHTLTLDQKYQEIRDPRLQARGGNATISDAKLEGDTIRFTVTNNAGQRRQFEGKVDGDTIRGNVTTIGQKTDWVATRRAS